MESFTQIFFPLYIFSLSYFFTEEWHGHRIRMVNKISSEIDDLGILARQKGEAADISYKNYQELSKQRIQDLCKREKPRKERAKYTW